MATKGRTPKHPKPHKGLRNSDRPNGKAWKKRPKTNDISTAAQILRRFPVVSNDIGEN